MSLKCVIIKGKGINPTQIFYQLEIKMVQLEPGTILEKVYKGNKIKVKVLKDGSFSYNGKQYEDRGSLMKAILKGKTGQFTNFFGLSKKDKPKKVKASVVEDVEDNTDESGDVSFESLVRAIAREEAKAVVKSLLNSFRGEN